MKYALKSQLRKAAKSLTEQRDTVALVAQSEQMRLDRMRGNVKALHQDTISNKIAVMADLVTELNETIEGLQTVSK